MTGSHERRIHADALHKQQQGRSLARFKRQAIAMLVSVAMGAMTLPCVVAGRDAIVATETCYWAEAKLWFTSAWARDAEVDVHIGDQVLPGRSARQIIAHPYFQRRTRQVWAWAKWGSALGFVGWLGVLLARRGVTFRRRERLLADRWIAGTAMTTG